MAHSVTELSKGGGDGARRVRRVLEGHVVARAPRELGAETRINALLIVAFGSDVADLLLGGVEGFKAWVELEPLEHAEFVDIADVLHGFKLVQVLRVVYKVEHEVVLHGDIEGLHLLRLSASLGDGRLNGVLGLHELVVLGPDVVDNAWGMNRVAMAIPVDLLHTTARLRFVVEVEEARELAVGITSSLIVSAGRNPLQPISGKILA